MHNDSLNEIRDPVNRSKLEGIQETAYDLGQAIIDTREAIKTKRGMVHACAGLAKRLFEECVPINRQVDEDTMTPEEAKIRIDQIKRLVSIVQSSGSENQTDMVKMEGKVMGLELGLNRIQVRFDSEAQKYLRHQRMEDEDELSEDNEEPIQVEPADASPPSPKKQSKKAPAKKASKK